MRPPVHTSAPGHQGNVTYSYVLMVQHLIERCLLLYMDCDECVQALAKHAHVKPAITLTVWKELEKENKDFFTAYARQRVDSGTRVFLDDATTRLCQQKLDECSEMLQGAVQQTTSALKSLSTH